MPAKSERAWERAFDAGQRAGRRLRAACWRAVDMLAVPGAFIVGMIYSILC